MYKVSRARYDMFETEAPNFRQEERKRYRVVQSVVCASPEALVDPRIGRI